MMQLDHYKKKYTDKNIQDALKFWSPFKAIKLNDNSVKSALTPHTLDIISSNNIDKDNDDVIDFSKKTTIFYTKNRNLQGKCLKFLLHWFIDIDRVGTNERFRWHPGYQEPDIFLWLSKDHGDSDMNENKLVSVTELCNHCAYWYLYRSFIKDSYFNLLFHNCEIITGNVLDTFMAWSAIICLLFFIFSKYYIFICISMFFFALLLSISSVHGGNHISYYKCNHVNTDCINIISTDEYYLWNCSDE